MAQLRVVRAAELDIHRRRYIIRESDARTCHRPVGKVFVMVDDGIFRVGIGAHVRLSRVYREQMLNYTSSS